MSRLRRRADRVRFAERTEERGQRPLLGGGLGCFEDPLAQTGLGAVREMGPKRLGDLRVGQTWGVHTSSSIAFSSAPRAACSRDLTVPTGIPSDRAISATGRSSTWWRTRIIRSCGRMRSKPRPIASWSTTSSNAVRARRSGGGSGSCGISPGWIGATDTSRRRTPVPAGHQRRVGDDPVEPAVERRRIAQARELSPGCQERVLGCVGSVRVVGQDGPGEAVAAIDPGIDEDAECRRIAGAGATNERVVGRRRRGRRSRQGTHLTLGPTILALANRDVAVDRCCRVSRCRWRQGGSVRSCDARPRTSQPRPASMQPHTPACLPGGAR